MMNYEESLKYLYNRLPMFQRVGAAAIKKDLDNTIRLLNALGNPQRNFRSIHVAGTNGKGTSAHALSSILQAAGYKTGLYTSPHLKSFTERIRIDGQEVEKDFISGFVTGHKGLIESINPSFFEVTVGMAFEYFDHQAVDIAIIETGLGGRLDSTNVLHPDIGLITMIGWDHADMLGDTLPLIAAEKAGIIKAKKPVVIGANQPELLPVFQKKAEEEKARLILSDGYSCSIKSRSTEHQVIDVMKRGEVTYPNLKTDITAEYFINNIPGILTVCDELLQQHWHISQEDIYTGLANIKNSTGLKGRWQVLGNKPQVVADCSHNAPGLESLFRQVKEMRFDRIHLIFGVVKDKDLSKIFPLLPPEADYYFTQSEVPRSLGADDLKNKAMEFGLEGQVFNDVNNALSAAKKKALENDLILICGSTFVVAEIDEL